MRQPDELSTGEAAALLGYKDRKSVIDLWRAGKLAGREEPVGLFGKRIYFRREAVEQLAREAKA